jgi:hypothetical protein
MSGAKSRRKGWRIERAVVALIHSHALAAEKISRTGYAGCDVSFPVCGVDRTVEVKCQRLPRTVSLDCACRLPRHQGQQ